MKRHRDWSEPISGSEKISFHARSTRSLRRHGLVGEPIVAEFARGELVLRGAEGGCVSFAAREVERLRLGFEATKYSRAYVARIWRLGDQVPLVLVPADRPARAYGAAMRGLARAVASAGGHGRVERGLSLQSAMAVPLAVLAVGSAGSGLAFFVWIDRGFWGAVGFAAAMAALVAMFTLRAFRLDMPRPVGSLEALERFLPGE